MTNTRGKFDKLTLNVNFQTFKSGTNSINVELTAYYCREDNTGECRIKTFVWQIPVEISAGNSPPKTILLNARIKN